ncbi:MAG: hypothetical protein GTO02_02150 [Candidatus Dadabacteria bacterium]|nr:hypothetical protein [Candidatus Dadabacteria bacterium]
MGLQNGIHTIIHEAPNAVLSAYTYTKIYADSAISPTINGTVIDLVAGTVIENIMIGEVSATSGLYLFGSPIDTTTGGSELSRVPIRG